MSERYRGRRELIPRSKRIRDNNVPRRDRRPILQVAVAQCMLAALVAGAAASSARRTSATSIARTSPSSPYCAASAFVTRASSSSSSFAARRSSKPAALAFDSDFAFARPLRSARSRLFASTSTSSAPPATPAMTPRNGPSEGTVAAEAASTDEASAEKMTAPESDAVTARRVPATPASLSECGARLRSGNLVSFPTETVYGLGGHALDPTAVRGIFAAKERPLSDPLIVHVTDPEVALGLWRASAADVTGDSGGGDDSEENSSSSSIESRALRALTSAFWPGPLTIVATSSPDVPPVVTASTGYVACRAPSHPVARALIDAAGVPVAAPSANKFGHVSPTRADHVLDDLGREDVWVVDPTMGEEEDGGDGPSKPNGAVNGAVNGAEEKGEEKGARICDVGVESTVAKVEMEADGNSRGSVVVLRHGAVSSSDIRRALTDAGLGTHFDVTSIVRSTPDHVANVAPGQTVRHYSPDVLSYMIAHSRYSNNGNGGNGDKGEGGGGGGVEDLSDEERALLSKAVVIDFGGRLAPLQSRALAYRDLSPSGESSEAAASVFEALRWAEDVAGAQRVYFPEVVVLAGSHDEKEGEANYMEEDALAHAVKDRLTRAASGEIVETLR